MKRSRPKRLLKPSEMDELRAAAIERDGGCCGKLTIPEHVCSHRQAGEIPPDAYGDFWLEFDHLLEQGPIGKLYSLGGVTDPVTGNYRPIRPHEKGFVEPEITATDIVKDTGTGLILCQGLHARRPNMKASEVFAIVKAAGLVETLEETANRYTIRHLLNRSFDFQWEKLKTCV